MKTMKLLLHSLLASLAALGTARAQNRPDTTIPARRPLLVGPSAAFMYGSDHADVPVYYGSGDCGIFSRGRTLASSLGGTFAFPSFLADRLDVSASLRFTFSSGRLAASPLVPLRTLDTDLGELVNVDTEYRLNIVSLETTADLMVSWRPAERFALSLGSFMGYRLFSTFTQTENVLEDEDFRFSNGHKEQPMVDGANPERAAFAFGPNLGVAYSFPFGPNRYLVPSLFVQTDILSSLNDYSLRGYRAGVSLSLLFDVSASPDSDPREDSIPAPPPPRLTASVEMYGIDEEDTPLPTARIQVYETMFQRHAPLLPLVFFDRDSTALPERYVQIDSGHAEEFSSDMLAETSILELQHHVLNIVGQRLREKKESTLVLAGSVSRNEPEELRKTRVETVRSYLETVWNIDPSRMPAGESMMERSNEETADGREDNRRVEIGADDLGILAPVATAQIIRDFDPPMIRMKPEIVAEAGIREWNLVVSQGDNQIARYSSDEEDSDTGEMVWRIVHDRVDSALSPLVATLTVEDSTGAVASASSMLPLVMVRSPRVVNQRIERSGDRERLAYTLVGFDFSSADLGQLNTEIVKGIAKMVRDGAVITVLGYTDRIGDGKRNRELAMERAINVARGLQRLLEEREVRDVTLNVSGEGAETIRFDNDLPEGRVLSRGVNIVVEQRTEEEPARP